MIIGESEASRAMEPKPSHVLHDAPPGAAAANPVAVGAALGWYLGAWQAPWMDASGTSNASVANATVEEESSPRHLGKIEAQGI